MASSSLCLFSLFVIIFLSAHFSASSSDDKVPLSVYYETFSRESSSFITSQLLNIVNTGLLDIVKLNLVPFGNAKRASNGTFICEHGTDECLLNLVEACAIKVCPEQELQYPFINCIQSWIYEEQASSWITCLDEGLGFSPELVEECYNGETGKQVFISNAEKTAALDPRPSFLPWVVVDGMPIFKEYRDYHSLVSRICEAYRGTYLPEACAHIPVEIVVE